MGNLRVIDDLTIGPFSGLVGVSMSEVRNEWSVKKSGCKVTEYVEYVTQLCKKKFFFVFVVYQFNFYFGSLNSSFLRILEYYSVLRWNGGYLETKAG